jgi:hypothetical protein
MRNKSDLYKEQQYNIVDNLINILNLDEDNGITLYDLDNKHYLNFLFGNSGKSRIDDKKS